MNTKIAKSAFQIIAGRIVYANNNFEQNFKSMKDLHEGEYGEAQFEIIDRAQHFQHRYFHGYLLPDIAFAMGESNLDNLKQFILKVKFLYRELPDGDYSQIPSKHRSNCRIVTRLEDGEEVVKGYIPSLSVLTYDEMAQFIKDCEDCLMYELNSYVGCSGKGDMKSAQAEALEYRKMANMGEIVKQEEKQESLFEEAV